MGSGIGNGIGIRVLGVDGGATSEDVTLKLDPSADRADGRASVKLLTTSS
jgi:hypothetical protein